MFPDDEEIYRAKITRMAPPKIEVLFVDYGNSAVVPWHHIFKLADKFSDTAAKVVTEKASGNMISFTQQRHFLFSFRQFTVPWT